MRVVLRTCSCAYDQDIFRAPVAFRECAHLFCSSCIRTHINQPGGVGAFCPNCRQKKAYDAELVAQPALEAAANHWRRVRPFLMKQRDAMHKLEAHVMQLQAEHSPSTSKHSSTLRPDAKRPADFNDTDTDTPRLRPRKRVTGTPDEDLDCRTLDADSIVQCPICQREFDVAALNAHLDRGCGVDDAKPTASMDAWLRLSSTPTATPGASSKRITRPQYQLKSERDLRKLLEVCT